MHVAYDLFGPESRYAFSLPFDSANWAWPGDAFSASGNRLDLRHSPEIISARTFVVWWPENNAKLRFLHMDFGPSNIQNLGTWIMPANSSTPVVDGGDVTDAIKALDGQYKFISYQLAGSGRVGVVRLEIRYGWPDQSPVCSTSAPISANERM